jgi:methanogenesis imperfect marker protein 11
LLTGVKIRLYESLAKQEWIRQRTLKKQFRTFVMVDKESGLIEWAQYMPEWAHCLAKSDMSGSEAGVQALEKQSHLIISDTPIVYGSLTVNLYKQGQIDVDCVPTLVPIVLSGVRITGESVVFTEKGIGGGPELIRMVSSDCKRMVETPMKGGGVCFDVEYPIYKKVVIGLDDTDSSVKGATFVTALQIAGILEKVVKDTKFLRMTISLNWPKNPAKTTNNASSAVVFATKPEREQELIDQFTQLATKYTISKETGMAVMRKVQVPEPLINYARKVKSVCVDVSESFKVSKQVGVEAIPITGERGIIGALSATGLVDNPAEATSPVDVTYR